MTICQKLREMRKQKGLRQIDVAKYLGFQSKNAYWSIEHGKTKLKAEQLQLLCEFYGVAPDDVLHAYQRKNM